MATLAAVMLVVGGAVVLWPGQWLRTGPADSRGVTPKAFHVETPQVLLEADSVTVEAAGGTFRPNSADVEVNSDPGWDHYTTLELIWHERGVEMRINLYFASDGTDWWVTEIRTYDGRDPGDWITRTGQFFRTHLGARYEGDVRQGSLRIAGARLEAFRPVKGCQPAVLGPPDYSGTVVPPSSSTTKPTTTQTLRINPYRPTIELSDGIDGYAYLVDLSDLRNCTVIPVEGSGVSISATISDPSVYPGDVTVVGGRIELSNQGLHLTAGRTTLHIVANLNNGEQIDTLDVPLVISAR